MGRGGGTNTGKWKGLNVVGTNLAPRGPLAWNARPNGPVYYSLVCQNEFFCLKAKLTTGSAGVLGPPYDELTDPGIASA